MHTHGMSHGKKLQNKDRKQKEKKQLPHLYSLLQRCHSHRCILRMQGQRQSEEELLQFYLSPCVKVGQQACVNTHTQTASDFPKCAALCVIVILWWDQALDDVGSWRITAFFQWHMCRGAKPNMTGLTTPVRSMSTLSANVTNWIQFHYFVHPLWKH